MKAPTRPVTEANSFLASSYRSLANVSRWPKPGIHQISVNARFRCFAVIQRASGNVCFGHVHEVYELLLMGSTLDFPFAAVYQYPQSRSGFSILFIHETCNVCTVSARIEQGRPSVNQHARNDCVTGGSRNMSSSEGWFLAAAFAVADQALVQLLYMPNRPLAPLECAQKTINNIAV